MEKTYEIGAINLGGINHIEYMAIEIIEENRFQAGHLLVHIEPNSYYKQDLSPVFKLELADKVKGFDACVKETKMMATLLTENYDEIMEAIEEYIFAWGIDGVNRGKYLFTDKETLDFYDPKRVEDYMNKNQK